MMKVNIVASEYKASNVIINTCERDAMNSTGADWATSGQAGAALGAVPLGIAERLLRAARQENVCQPITTSFTIGQMAAIASWANEGGAGGDAK